MKLKNILKVMEIVHKILDNSIDNKDIYELTDRDINIMAAFAARLYNELMDEYDES